MTLLGVVGLLLPIGAAAAFSMTPLMVTVLLLLSPRARPNALVFLIAYAAALFLVTLGLTAGLALLPDGGLGREPPVVAGLEIVVGLLLVVYGVRAIIRRGSTATPVPKWMGRVDGLGPAGALGTAVLLNLRPKALLLGVAAGLLVAGAGLDATDAVIAVAVYTVLGASSIAAPVVISYAAPARTAVWLHDTREWITTNGQAVTLVVAVIVGVAIFGHGLANL